MSYKTHWHRCRFFSYYFPTCRSVLNFVHRWKVPFVQYIILRIHSLCSVAISLPKLFLQESDSDSTLVHMTAGKHGEWNTIYSCVVNIYPLSGCEHLHTCCEHLWSGCEHVEDVYSCVVNIDMGVLEMCVVDIYMCVVNKYSRVVEILLV